MTDHPLIRKKAKEEVPKKTIIGLKVETVDMDDPLGADPLAEMDPLSAGLAGVSMEDVYVDHSASTDNAAPTV